MSTAQDRGASSPQLMRRANRQAVMQHALRAESFTAADAMAATGLTRATVLGVCTELEQVGWLHEVTAGRDGAPSRGRPARHFALRADAAVLVGVDAGQHTLTARAADLRGHELAAARSAAGGELDGVDVEAGAAAAEERVEAVRALIDEVLDHAGALDRPRLLTVVGVPAPVDAAGRSPIGDKGYWPAMNPGLVDALEGTVLVENDANLAVLAERAHAEAAAGRAHGPAGGPADASAHGPAGGPADASAHGPAEQAAGADHLATLLMGERFGAGLVVDGHLLRGADGGAGEMRFLDGMLADSRGADGVAALARRWTLEALAAGESSPALADIPSGELTAIDVFAAAREGDPLARSVLERIGERLARIAAILSSLLGVEAVVVAGAIADAIEPVLAHSRTVLRQIISPPHPQLRASALGRDVVVQGALELALTRLREDPLGLLAPAPRTDPHPPNDPHPLNEGTYAS
ncbi:ROK family protein [Brachybacterium sp. AOP43-C2-M15]|uniref:ROK family protein n=1 Tax=Brachybacterium sp. AOP43-C2-M15 TaxID=3457661 RepID=UPI00403325B6